MSVHSNDYLFTGRPNLTASREKRSPRVYIKDSKPNAEDSSSVHLLFCPSSYFLDCDPQPHLESARRAITQNTTRPQSQPSTGRPTAQTCYRTICPQSFTSKPPLQDPWSIDQLIDLALTNRDIRQWTPETLAAARELVLPNIITR